MQDAYAALIELSQYPTQRLHYYNAGMHVGSTLIMVHFVQIYYFATGG